MPSTREQYKLNPKPKPLLTQGNSDLKRDNVWVWTLPAWVTELDDGRTVNTCPSAGVCAKLCYARRGTYNFSNVKAAHHRNLKRVLDDLWGWEAQLKAELQHPKFVGASVRIHDAGDFFSADYLFAWMLVISSAPNTTFYAYTKEIELFRRMVEPRAPQNFRYVYSYGGRQDHLITEQDRQANVFATVEALQEAGFNDQADSDLLAITGPPKVGIVANNHPAVHKAMQGQSFKQLQEGRHNERRNTKPSNK